MSRVKYMDEEAVIEKAVKVLMKELGPVERIRFINLPIRKFHLAKCLKNGNFKTIREDLQRYVITM